MFSISDMFKSSQPAQVAQPVEPTPGAPGNLPAGAAPQIQPPAPVEAEATESTPLDQYSALWETDPSTQSNSTNLNYVPQLSQEQLNKVMGSVDFSKAASPELLQTALSGGEGAPEALMQLMSSVGQHAVMQATLVNNKLTEEAVRNAVERTRGDIPELLRSQSSNEESLKLNPLLKNPAVTPIIEAAQAQFLAKNPQASASDIAKMTNEFANAMGKHFAPAAPAQTTTANADQDWSKWLNN